MASAYTKTTFLEAVLLSALPVVFAHGGDEAMDMEGMISEHSQDPSIDPISLPPSYFSHPNGKGTIYLHITLMSLAWVLVLPVAVMLSLVRSRYTLIAQVTFLVVNTVGLIVGTIYNARTPDLYPNNLHHKVGWAVTVITAVHVLTAFTAKLVGVFRPRASRKHPPYDHIPMLTTAINEYERLHKPNRQSSSLYDLSNDSVNPLDTFRRSHSMSTAVAEDEHQPIPLNDTSGNHDEDDDLEPAELIPPPSPKTGFTWAVASVGGKISGKAWKAIEALYDVVDRVLPVLGFLLVCTGFATYGRLFEGHGIFNGLAHWIKGGIFFWYGIFTLGRWAGSFGERGWAWNLSPRKTKHLTSEFMESALIFTYGATNIFLEHLGNWGKEWTAEDLEHISITVLFIGGGLCGMLIESSRIRHFLNTNIKIELGPWSNSNEEDVCISPPPPSNISLNPLPALVVLLVGIMMSSHTQSAPMGTMVHKQWGNLLSGAAFARTMTYVLIHLKPPKSVHPSRPPTELLAAFALMAGGLIFMASSSDTVDGMIASKVNEMFVYTCVTGLVGIAMAWVLLLVALKGWAVRRERR